MDIQITKVITTFFLFFVTAIAEILGHPVEIVPGSPQNFKLTTPFDLALARTLYSNNS